MSEDRLKLTRGKLPPHVRRTIDRLTGSFDEAAKASVARRAGGTFATLERADMQNDDGDAPATAALREGAALRESTNVVSIKRTKRT